MPIALLLDSLVKKLERSARTLNTWNQLVELEELLVARAQSAFLVHWFGTRLPTQGLSVRVAIVNLPALQTRFAAAMGASRGEDRNQMNLAEPLAGFAGTVVGSVGSVIAGAFAILGTLAPQIVGAVIVALVGGGTLLGIRLKLNPDQLELIYELLGNLAELADPFIQFWRVVSGPRERVQNPLLREMLLIGDKLATLVPHLIALVAIVFARIGGMIEPLIEQFSALMDLIGASIKVINEIFTDWMTRLKGALAGDHSIVALFKGAFDVLKQIVPVLRRAVLRHIKPWFKMLETWGKRIKTELQTWWDTARTQIRDAFNNNPVILLLKGLGDVVAQFRSIWASTAPPPEPSGVGGRALEWAWEQIQEGFIGLFGPPPDFPDTSTLPDFGMYGRAAAESPFPFDRVPEVGKTLTRLARIFGFGPMSGIEDSIRAMRRRQPTDVFAAERAELGRQLGATPERTLSDIAAEFQRQETRYRDLLFEIVQRALPAEASGAVASLAPRLREIDALLHAPATETPPEYPVRLLTESDKLKPVVRRVNVRVRGGNEPQVREWVEGLKQALRTQVYVAVEPALPV